MMIVSFANKLAEDFFEDVVSKEVRAFPNNLHRIARKKITYLNETTSLNDLMFPPGNRLESLKGDRAGFFSLRINSQWRIIFKWVDGDAYVVSIEDYH
jgi:proteic killer suppression protein